MKKLKAEGTSDMMDESTPRPAPTPNLPRARYFTINMTRPDYREYVSFDDAVRYAHSTNKKCQSTRVLACAQNEDVFVCL